MMVEQTLGAPQFHPSNRISTGEYDDRQNASLQGETWQDGGVFGSFRGCEGAHGRDGRVELLRALPDKYNEVGPNKEYSDAVSPLIEGFGHAMTYTVSEASPLLLASDDS
jgi:hypothetical protein